MSVQRRKARRTATFYSLAAQVDKRGNKVLAPDMGHGSSVRAFAVPERSARAETPGQTQINVIKLLVGPEVPARDAHLWNIVDWDGRRWDVAAPPEWHEGTRRTRHWSVTLRERPS